MARTKQTARKTTGGKSARGPRKMLTTEPIAPAQVQTEIQMPINIPLKATISLPRKTHRFKPGFINFF